MCGRLCFGHCVYKVKELEKMESSWGPPPPPHSKGWRGGGDAAVQNKEKIIAAKLHLYIRQVSAFQTSEHFMSEPKDVALCTYILES
jgi:hypothetical protein